MEAPRHTASSRFRRLGGIGLLTLCVAMTGCSSIPNLESDKPLPYGGIRSWGRTTVETARSAVTEEQPTATIVGLYGACLLAIDLPCSFILDTLTLPWPLYRMMQPGPALIPPYTIPRFM
jgi:uncharacterized protein YceK